MATQRFSIACLGGKAAELVTAQFTKWRASALDVDQAGVDRFCTQLHVNAGDLSVLYFSEWIDRWLMDDFLPGPGAVRGRLFELTCMSPAEAVARSSQCGTQFQEQRWLAVQLREAATAWESLIIPRVVVMMREVLGASASDEEVRESLEVVPGWLSGLARQ